MINRLVQKLLFSVFCLMATFAHAADVTIIVPYSAGGPTSQLATRLAAALNASGARSYEVRHNNANGGSAAMQELSAAPKDGSIVVLGDLSLMLTLRAGTSGLDLSRDFEAAATIGSRPLMLITPANGKIQNLQQARAVLAAGGTIGANGMNTVSGLCADLLRKEGGLGGATAVPYRGTAPMIADLLGGQITVACVEATNQVLSRMTVLGISGASAATVFQGVPTFQSQGLQLKLMGLTGLFAPKGTPVAILDNLQTAVTNVTRQPEFRSFLANEQLITPE